MKTEKPLVIQFRPGRGYAWTCRYCTRTWYTDYLWEAEHDGFAHVAECRGTK